jgi:hypothetical protein
MSVKEHLQFLVMMIPTFLLLCAVTASLAFPAPGASLAPPAEHLSPE